MPVIKIVKGKQTVVCRLPSIYLLLANSVNDGLGVNETAGKTARELWEYKPILN